MRRVPGGFWKRPTCRTYAYNLDLGEHYYSPMTSYLQAERGLRGQSPGAMTYGERLAHRWIGGRRYGASEYRDRYSRAASIGPVDRAYISSSSMDRETSVRRAAQRARSEMRENRASTPPFEPEIDPWNVSAYGRYKQALFDSANELRSSSFQRQNELMNRRSSQLSETAMARQAAAEASAARSSMQRSRAESALRASSASREVNTSSAVSRMASESSRRVDDDVLKKISDLHMMPWTYGPELEEAQTASARARARITELERELDAITKRALSTRSYGYESAASMSKKALMEDEAAMASSYKKSRKVMSESVSRM